jgi:hypothetical protein
LSLANFVAFLSVLGGSAGLERKFSIKTIGLLALGVSWRGIHPETLINCENQPREAF